MPSSLGPVAILAGSGRLPVLLSDSLRRQRQEHRILAVRGFATAATRSRADAVLDLLDVKGILDCLAGWGPASVTLAGAVRRPHLSAFLSAFSAFRNRRELAELMERGDDQLLGAAVALIERQGHRISGLPDLAPELLARAGPIGGAPPSPEMRRSIEIGFQLLSELSPYDFGQAGVVFGERVLAVEGPEGTDQMLSRVSGFRRPWARSRVPPGGVLVKAAKRGQDFRVDLPAIGPRTIAKAHAAGITGVAVEAGTTLVLDEEELARIADKLGLFVVGVEHTAGGRSVQP